MGAGRKTETFHLNGREPSSPKQDVALARNLGKTNLGGVIFGCKNNTIKECLFKQIFGLPAQHFSYVQNISPGLPLFLFNYSDRKFYGIFEAASSGQMNINPYAWTSDGSERTLYPAQVQIRIKLQCQPLLENQFKPIILDNYYKPHHFWFELDHAQTNKLLSKLSSMAFASGPLSTQGVNQWTSIFRSLPTVDKMDKIGSSYEQPPVSTKVENPHDPNMKFSTSESSLSSDGQDTPSPHTSFGDPVPDRDEKDLMYLQLKELALNRESLNVSMRGHTLKSSACNDQNLQQEFSQAEQAISEENETFSGNSLDSPDYPLIIAQLLQGMEELKAFKEDEIQKTDQITLKLLEAEEEIRQLKHRCILLESVSNPSMVHTGTEEIESHESLHLDLDESIFLVGGYDGISWLSALDLFCPSLDVLKSLKPMSYDRSYCAVVKLYGELYAFGGGNSSLWYDTVESYNPLNNQWSLRPSLNVKKGSLAGATLDNKIFAIGGGNGAECFSDVEMYDVIVGRWIPTQSMLQKRFALAAAELNGALYAVGGYGGYDEDVYLKSAERFDPREHYWSRIDSMSTSRGCHSLVIMNEKLYAIGGYDGSSMSSSVEIYDPRLGKWMVGEPMNNARGYLAAAVLNESLYVSGGVKSGDDIVDTVECYKEGEGWQVTNLRATRRRCFCSAIVLGQD